MEYIHHLPLDHEGNTGVWRLIAINTGVTQPGIVIWYPQTFPKLGNRMDSFKNQNQQVKSTGCPISVYTYMKYNRVFTSRKNVNLELIITVSSKIDNESHQWTSNTKTVLNIRTCQKYSRFISVKIGRQISAVCPGYFPSTSLSPHSELSPSPHPCSHNSAVSPACSTRYAPMVVFARSHPKAPKAKMCSRVYFHK